MKNFDPHLRDDLIDSILFCVDLFLIGAFLVVCVGIPLVERGIKNQQTQLEILR